MLHTFSIVTFPPQNWYILFQRGQITQQIFENCMAKLSFFYIIKYPLEYGCCTLFCFCHTKPKHTWAMLRNNFQLKIIVLYLLLQNLLLYPPLSSALAELFASENYQEGKISWLISSNFKCYVFKLPDSSICIFGSSAP